MNFKMLVLLLLIALFLTSIPVGAYLYAPSLKGITRRQLKIVVLCWAIIILLASFASFGPARWLSDNNASNMSTALFMACYFGVMLSTAVVFAKKRKRPSQ